MGYFESRRKLPPGDYSPELLELDVTAGPWLTERQTRFDLHRDRYPYWDLDLEEGLIRFGDKERIGLIAQVQLLGTYSPEDGLWLWAWSNPDLKPWNLAAAQVRDRYPEIPELATSALPCTETKAWALAAVAAHHLEADGCYRLPGEVTTFIGVFGLTEIPPDDPRSRRVAPDEELAREALAAYAGPAALTLGGLLRDWVTAAVEEEAELQEAVLETIQEIGENLEDLSRSPVGKGTEAATEADELRHLLGQSTLCLAAPGDRATLEATIAELLALLRDVAQRYGAWPTNET